MPLSFSFFSQRRTPTAPQPRRAEDDFGHVAGAAASANAVNPAAASPTSIGTGAGVENGLFAPPQMMPVPFPRPITGGLAALAVAQNDGSSPVPPLNRRVAAPTPPPSPAMAANVAMPPQPVQAPMPAPPPNQPVMAPAPAHEGWHGGPLVSREMALLEQELKAEIDQVKSDLFGAAMGVSALKDRIDGLEGQMTHRTERPAMPLPAAPAISNEELCALVQGVNMLKDRLDGLDGQMAQHAERPSTAPSAAPGISQEEVCALIQEILEKRLTGMIEAAVQRALDGASQQQTATLSSSEFFRLPVRPAAPDRQTLFAQPPLILSSSPS